MCWGMGVAQVQLEVAGDTLDESEALWINDPVFPAKIY